jgi:hypothetical protein
MYICKNISIHLVKQSKLVHLGFTERNSYHLEACSRIYVYMNIFIYTCIGGTGSSTRITRYTGQKKWMGVGIELTGSGTYSS